MKEEQSLDSILDDLDLTEPVRDDLRGGTITIWLTPEYKAKYDKLQEVTRGRFIKKVRELIKAAIDRTQTRAS